MAPALITAALAVGVYLMTWAAATGRLSANGMMGIRTRATQRSEAAWRAAHQAALRVLAPASILTVVLCVLALLAPWGVSTEAAGVALLIGYGVVVLAAAVVAQRAATATAVGQLGQ